MELEKIEKNLPENVVLEEEYRRYKATWMAALGRAQTAYETLLADKDIGSILPDFENLSAEWIQDFVAGKVAAVMESPNTYNARMESADEWRILEKDLLKTLEPIEQLRKIDPKAKIDAKGCHITIENLEELLHEKTTFEVPEWYKNCYGMVVEAADRVQRLNAYQVKHGIKNPAPLFGILSMAGRPEDFIRHLIFEDSMKKTYEEQKKIPSHFQKQFDEHAEEVKRQESERKKRFDEARAEKIRNGEQVDFGVSIREIGGKEIPVSSRKE